MWEQTLAQTEKAPNFALCLAKDLFLCSDFILSWHYYFYMHALLITANVLQLYPSGHNNYTCALEGT